MDDPSDVTEATQAFRAARDLLLDLREDQDAARARFRWPRPERFNYARDWFDVVAGGPSGGREALVVLESDGADLFYCGGGASGRLRAVRRPRRAKP